MDDHPNAVVIRRLFEAFDNLDVAEIETLVAPDVVWHFPGRSGGLAGDYQGRNEVFAFLANVIGLSEGSFHLDLIDVVANDRRAVVLFRGTATRGARQLDNPTCLSVELREGRVVELWEFVWDLYQVDDFWS